MKRFALALIFLFSLSSLTGFGMRTSDLSQNSETEKTYVVDSENTQMDMVVVSTDFDVIVNHSDWEIGEVPIESELNYTSNIHTKTSTSENYPGNNFRKPRDGFRCR